ncbi:MAG: tRNA 2-selenouridine(34) synthase MnmH [Bacteroidetes bacterium]|nr:tRNA 2-selenouridine(34) synthase MnmH [Bacteroidota bacterium]
MVSKTKADTFLDLEGTYSFVDVRSPGEFTLGHIPGAVNIPLFTDDERAVIGTLYQKQGREPAILKGLDIALPKVFNYLKELKGNVPFNKVAVYCWRGGMRSELMSEVFSTAGYHVSLLEGGYKAYRRFIRESFFRISKIRVLGGYTGCGKTEILKSLSALGEQVIDLENIASHKGSVFGALGQGLQPGNEQFENNLYRLWAEMDFRKRIWMEDESRSIGKVTLPPPVFEQISNGKLVEVVMDKKQRINRLVAEYAGFDKELLAEALFRIREGLGGTRYNLASKALSESNFSLVAEIVLEYYDKAYRKAIEKRQNKDILTIKLKGSDPRHHAKKILAILKNSKNDPGLS